ncbi:unnamed protein product [Chondrus crispus]|uniref:GOLD domain-containing protein n=1 Tax=Chondrus crispus TaxID=2769 RepID=R7Q4A8_CHOCR|nr:unnamed protein product [Chondrus crispus]CDF32844.1 unnamed protein product [Chondrus crispus]|eukprot:XP_005712645.1 unnamed protein product [Chondrus crispus]
MQLSFNVALQLAAILSVALSFGIQVPAGEKSCFYRELRSNMHVSLHYVARETVSIAVQAPSKEGIYSKTSVLQGEHSFNAKEDGPYQFCVSTDSTRRAPTIAKFRFLAFPPDVFNSDIAKSTQAFDARMLTLELSKISDKVLYSAHLYADTTSATDETLKSSIALTGRLAALECVAVLVVALAQVKYVRNILSATRSKVQRMV